MTDRTQGRGTAAPSQAPLRAAVFGPFPPRWLPQDEAMLSACRVVCLPAAAEHVLAHGLFPEAVCGPGTQLRADDRRRLEARGVRFLPARGTEPWELLALGINYAITTGATEIWVLGVVGPHLADTLPHLLVLARPEWGGARLHLVHGPERGYLLRHGEGATMEGQSGDLVTFLPLSPTVSHLTTQGTDPIYREEPLTFGEARGARLTGKVAQAWIAAGRLLVLHQRA